MISLMKLIVSNNIYTVNYQALHVYHLSPVIIIKKIISGQ